jgi:hypothetical protein
LIAIQRGFVAVPGAAPANGELAITGELIETGEPVEATPAAPPVEIEPALPLRRRFILIALALLAIGLIIAAPRGSAQSSGQSQPFSDSPASTKPSRSKAAILSGSS